MSRVAFFYIAIISITGFLSAQELSSFVIEEEQSNPINFSGDAYLGFGVESLMDTGRLNPIPLFGLNAHLDYDSESVVFRSHILLNELLLGISDASMIHRLLIRELYIMYQFLDIGLDLRFGYQGGTKKETNLIEVEDTIHQQNHAVPFVQLFYQRIHPSLMLHLQYYIDTSSALEAWYIPIYEAGFSAQEHWQDWYEGRGELPQPTGSNQIGLSIPASTESGQAGIRYAYSGSKIAASVGYSYQYFTRPQLAAWSNQNPEATLLSYDRAHRFSASFDAYAERFQWFSQAAFFLSEDFSGDDPFTSNHELRYDLGMQYEIPYGPIIIGTDVNGVFVVGNDQDGFIAAADFQSLQSPRAQEQYIADILQASSISFRFYVDMLLFFGVVQGYVEAVLEYPTLDYLVQSRLSFLLHTTLRLNFAFGIYETASSPYFGSLHTRDYLSISISFFY